MKFVARKLANSLSFSLNGVAGEMTRYQKCSPMVFINDQKDLDLFGVFSYVLGTLLQIFAWFIDGSIKCFSLIAVVVFIVHCLKDFSIIFYAWYHVNSNHSLTFLGFF